MKISCFLCSTEYYADDAGTPCPCCHTVQSVKGGDIDLYRGLYAASEQMREKRFNKARQMYLTLCREYPDSFYAFFGLAASKYGLTVEQNNGRYIPRCLCADENPFVKEPAFKKACALASAADGENYDSNENVLRKFGEEIEKDRAEIANIASMIPSYDIFLSINYDPESKSYDRTADRLYSKLVEQGNRVFFAPEIIPEADDRHAAPFVFRALRSCEQMLIYIGDRSDLGSFRLRNEVTRYTALIAAGEKPEDSISVAYSGISHADIPPQLRKFPSFEIRAVGKADEPTVVEEPQNEETQSETIAEDTEESESTDDVCETENTEISEEIPEVSEIKEPEEPEETAKDQTPPRSEDAEEEQQEVTSEEEEPPGILFEETSEELPQEETDEFSDEKNQLPNIEVIEEREPYIPKLGLIFFGMFKKYFEDLKNSVSELKRVFSETPPQSSEEADLSDGDTHGEFSSDNDDESGAEQEALSETEDAVVPEPVEESSEPTEEAAEHIDESGGSVEESSELATDEVSETAETTEEEVTPSEETPNNTPDDSVVDDSIDSIVRDNTSDDDAKTDAGTAKKRGKMSKPLCTVIVVIACFIVLTGSAVAAYFTGWIFADFSGIEFIKNETGYTVSKYNGSNQKLKVPSRYHGKKVTSIEAGAFKGSDITSLDLPKYLEKCEEGALSGLSNLKVLTLNGYICGGSSKISERSREEVVSSLLGYLFGSEKFSKSVEITQTSSYGKHNFFVPINLGTVVVKGGNVPYGFMSGFTMVENVTLKNTVRIMEAYAFTGCSKLSKVDLGNKVICVGDKAFCDCVSLVSVKGGKNVYVIGDDAFSNCSLLESITFGKHLYTIGESAFYGCASIDELNLPESLEGIGDYCFGSCSSLKRMHIPSGVSGYYDGVFSNCTSLVTFSGGEGLEGFGDNFFIGCTSLVNVNYPETELFTKLGDNAFFVCSSLSSFCTSPYLESIGSSCYVQTRIAGKLVFPDSLKSIGDKAFELCREITSVSVPKHCTVGRGAFANCSELKYARIEADDIPEIMFMACENLEKVELIGNNIKIGARAFCGCSTLTEIIGLDKISVLGDEAFYYCTSFQTISLPNVTEVGYGAFRECKVLKDVELGKNLTTIGRYAFSGCVNIDILTVPKSVTYVGEYCFANWSRFQTLNMERGISTRGWHIDWMEDCNAETIY